MKASILCGAFILSLAATACFDDQTPNTSTDLRNALAGETGEAASPEPTAPESDFRCGDFAPCAGFVCGGGLECFEIGICGGLLCMTEAEVCALGGCEGERCSFEDVEYDGCHTGESGECLEDFSFSIRSFTSCDEPAHPTSGVDEPTAPEDLPTAPQEPTAPEDLPTAPQEPTAPKDLPTAPEDLPTAPEDLPTAPEELPTEF